MVLLQADCVSGVCEVASFDKEASLLDADDFYRKLNRHDDGTIAAAVDKELAGKIDDEYGITRLKA